MNARNTVPAMLLFLLVGSQVPAVASSEVSAAGSSRVVVCAFSNPAYSGWCRVRQDLPQDASAAAVCRSVLSCLNDVRCLKTYCNATTIREHWRLETVSTRWKKS